MKKTIFARRIWKEKGKKIKEIERFDKEKGLEPKKFGRLI